MKKKRKKLKFRALILIIFILFLASLFIYYLWTTPIKEIEIKGNHYLKDNYIITYLDLNKESVLRASRSKIKKKLLALDLVNSVKIHKNYFGKITIIIEEDEPLFYNLSKKKVVLSNNKEVDYSIDFLGLPVLINFVPLDIYNEFVQKLSTISNDVLSLVSEIEYSPSMINDKVIDDKRFLFRMNDGNTVYINTINIEKFNNYLEIYEVIVNKNGKDIKGCLYLDSNSENNHFNNCEENIVMPEGSEGSE